MNYKITINYGDYSGTKKATLYRLKTFKILKWSFSYWDYEDQYRAIHFMIYEQVGAWKELYNVADEMIFDETLLEKEI